MHWRGVLQLLTFTCLALLNGHVALLAQTADGTLSSRCSLDTRPVDIRPKPEGPPTRVSVGFRLVDLTEVDDVKQTLEGDYAVRLTWQDESLSGYAGCELPLDKVWSPGIAFFNSGRLHTSHPREVTVSAGGRVRYLQRYFGSVASYHNLKDFPFDRQSFIITLAPVDLPATQVELVVDEEFTGIRDRLNISDWVVGSVRGYTEPRTFDAYNLVHSSYNFEIEATRITSYYVWKIFLPLVLIVIMSWFAFWIAPVNLPEQITLSSTSFLTLIAFLFATSSMVPKLGYFTRLDWFILGSTITVFLALLESVVTGILVSKGHVQQSLRIDYVCRGLFPLAFVIFLIVVVAG